MILFVERERQIERQHQRIMATASQRRDERVVTKATAAIHAAGARCDLNNVHAVQKVGEKIPKTKIQIPRKIEAASPASHNLNDLDAVSIAHLASGKFRRRDGLPVMFHHNAARQNILRAEKCFKRTRQIRRHIRAVGDDSSGWHSGKREKTDFGRTIDAHAINIANPFGDINPTIPPAV